jgi:hypothetical protein
MGTLIAIAVLAALAWTAGYAIACWIWPFTACRRCDGNGKLRSPSGRAWRRCRRCRGSGGRLRAGRWLYNHLIKMRRDAD